MAKLTPCAGFENLRLPPFVAVAAHLKYLRFLVKQAVIIRYYV